MPKSSWASLQDRLAYAPRMLRADRAAAYCGMSESSFLALVKEGLLPKPTKLKGIVLWDRTKLDSALDALQQEPPAPRRNTMDEAMGITTDDEE